MCVLTSFRSVMRWGTQVRRFRSTLVSLLFPLASDFGLSTDDVMGVVRSTWFIDFFLIRSILAAIGSQAWDLTYAVERRCACRK